MSAAAAAVPHEELLSSVVSDIKAYAGDDPLRPWLRGIRRMRQCLPRQALAEKLPRFLQKCAQAFESDRHYRNDLRYLRVWILLMDHVDDPRGVLRRMEENRIGVNHSAFYVAYALYYEKQRKFEKAEKMYRLGAQNLAEPAAELQKSYEQFLCRMKQYRKRIAKLKEAQAHAISKGLPDHQREINIYKDDNAARLKKAEVQMQNDCQMVKIKGIHHGSLQGEHHKNSDHTNMMGLKLSSVQETYEDTRKCMNASWGKSILKTHLPPIQREGVLSACTAQPSSSDCVSNTALMMSTDRMSFEGQRKNDEDLVKQNSFSSDDTVVVKFVGSAIVGKSEAEDACHHGLVDPTINMKEAMNAINRMFREPLEPDPKLKRKLQQNRTKANAENCNGFEVFVDENLDEEADFVNKRMESANHKAVQTALPTKHTEIEKSKPFVGTFKILADDEDDSECAVQTTLPKKHIETQKSKPSVGTFKILADDDDSEHDDVDEVEIKKFAESSRLPLCHFNAPVLLEPKNLLSGSCDDSGILPSEYVKLKEDTVICNFVGSTVSGEHEVENACHHGLVDPTINLKEALHDINSMFGKPIDFVRANKPKKKTHLSEQKQVRHAFSILVDENQDLPTGATGESCRESDLFEPTMFTKEAIDEINKMFGKPFDF